MKIFKWKMFHLLSWTRGPDSRSWNAIWTSQNIFMSVLQCYVRWKNGTWGLTLSSHYHLTSLDMTWSSTFLFSSLEELDWPTTSSLAIHSFECALDEGWPPLRKLQNMRLSASNLFLANAGKVVKHKRSVNSVWILFMIATSLHLVDITLLELLGQTNETNPRHLLTNHRTPQRSIRVRRLVTFRCFGTVGILDENFLGQKNGILKSKSIR